jgi:MerR family transcriptional regulator, light-induced transcriptional regulator
MNGSPETTYVSTSQVAEALGISVSTVKRWVDEGVLPARKTPGGHRKLVLADVLEFSRRGNFPQLDLSRLTSPRRGHRQPQVSQLARTLPGALVRGDRESVRSVILGAYRAGIAVEVLADEVIAPAMHQIGHDWENGRIDVLHEHRSTQLCQAVLYELMTLLEVRAAAVRPVAVGGSPEGDPYSLATLLAQMVLTDAGWNATNLGPNTPLTSLSKAVAELRPRLVWLSVSYLLDVETFVRDYRAFYHEAERAGVAVALGGQGLTESLRSRLPYTTFGDGLSNLAAFARTLHVRPRQPRRGRPRTKSDTPPA